MNFRNLLISLSFLSIFKQIISQNSKSIISGSTYLQLTDKNDFNFDSSYLLYSYSFNPNFKQKCLANCTKITECIYAVIKQNECFMFKMNFTLIMDYKPTGTSLIFKKQLFKITKGLINYWSFNENVNDAIGRAHLFGGVNVSLTYDRFGIPNSALRLTNGYYRVPPGIYFTGTQLTIMGWVNVRSINTHSRLIDFGFADTTEVVFLSLSNGDTGKPYLYYRSGNDKIFGYSNKILILNQWQHLACVFSFPFYSIYIDGVEVTTSGS